MDRIIEVKVYGNHLTKDSNNAGTRGEANATKLRITFDKSWDNFTKTFIFWDAYGQNPVSVLGSVTLMEGTTNVYLVPIPEEAMARAGELTFSIRGEGTDSRQVSITGKLEVEDSPEVLEALPPTPNQWSQMQQQFDEVAGNLMKVNTAIDEDIPEAMSEIEKTKKETLKAEANAVEQANYAAERAETANGAAFDAGESANRAAGLADYAEQCAERAAECLVKSPYIGEDGYWYVWNDDLIKWGKTNIRGQGGSIVYYGENPPDDADVWINPNGEATDADPQNATIITCEAEGESIHISDSAALPMKGLRVCGKTKQLKSTGKNLIPPYKSLISLNNTPSSGINNGISYVVNDDGSVVFNGTATGTALFHILNRYDFNQFPAGTYTLSGAPRGVSSSYNTQQMTAYKSDSQGNNRQLLGYDRGEGCTFTLDGTYTVDIIIAIYEGFHMDNVLYKPQLEKGSTVSAFEPYTNGIPSPSPEYPQPMNSAGKDGSIGIEISNGDGSESQTISVPTPNGLPGVPVSYDGFEEYPIEHMYTDDKGNKWVCDEINFDKGEYIKRVDNMPFAYMFDGDRQNYRGINFYTAISLGNKRFLPYGALCNMGHIDQYDTFPTSDNAFNLYEESLDDGGVGTGIEFAKISDGLTREEFSASLRGIQFLGILKEPIVTPLSEEQINAYKRIIMHKPTTTITNDDGAHIAVEYIADAKTYIDNKFAELQKAMVANV